MAYNEVFKKQNSEPTVATIPKAKNTSDFLPVAAVRLQGKGKDEKTRHFNVNQLDFKKTSKQTRAPDILGHSVIPHTGLLSTL